MAWDALYEAQPTDSTYVADTDDAIRSTKTEIRTRVAKEHGFNLSESAPQTGHGKHLRGSARVFVNDTDVADPTTVTADDANYSTGRLQVYPTLKRLGYYSGSAWVDLIRNSAGQLFSEVATGTAPMVVASTTVTPNLNADLHDGYHAGNSSGQIPVSNGTLNTNLNAQFLGGQTSMAGFAAITSTPSIGSMSLAAYATDATLTGILVGETRIVLNSAATTKTFATPTTSGGKYLIITTGGVIQRDAFSTFTIIAGTGAFVVRYT